VFVSKLASDAIQHVTARSLVQTNTTETK
jgi:hypothetical protein